MWPEGNRIRIKHVPRRLLRVGNVCLCGKKRSSGLTDSESKEHRPVPPVFPVERLRGMCMWVQAFLERTASQEI